MLKHILNVLISNFFVTLIGLANSFIFPKILTIDNYAIYHTFTLYISYISILHLGFPSGMVINYAGQEYKKIDKAQYKCEVITLLKGLAFFSVIGTCIALTLHNKMLFFIGIAIVPICMNGSYKSLYQAWGRFKTFARINMFIPAAISIIALIIYFLSGDLNSDQYIVVYLVVNSLVLIFIIKEFFKDTISVKANKIFNKRNWITLQYGFAMMIGNYINTLFHSVDKQFIKILFDNYSFAMYSFGMSMQSIMTIFITSIAQPLFPKMATGTLTTSDYKIIKELLFIFGSFSGCAYFVCSFIVENYIQKYIESLPVISAFFMVFPAMAVINCLYINLYKINRKMKLYVRTLALILIISVVLNGMASYLVGDFYSIAIATTITYYIWLYIGTRHFQFLKLTFRDICYLIVFFITYTLSINIKSLLLGTIIYLVIIIITMVIIYGANLKKYLSIYQRRNRV